MNSVCQLPVSHQNNLASCHVPHLILLFSPCTGLVLQSIILISAPECYCSICRNVLLIHLIGTSYSNRFLPLAQQVCQQCNSSGRPLVLWNTSSDIAFIQPPSSPSALLPVSPRPQPLSFATCLQLRLPFFPFLFSPSFPTLLFSAAPNISHSACKPTYINTAFFSRTQAVGIWLL